MSDDKKNKRVTRDRAKQASGETSGSGSQASDRDVGHALRSVYSSTVNEDIPAELIDLLGKLS